MPLRYVWGCSLKGIPHPFAGHMHTIEIVASCTFQCKRLSSCFWPYKLFTSAMSFSECPNAIQEMHFKCGCKQFLLLRQPAQQFFALWGLESCWQKLQAQKWHFKAMSSATCEVEIPLFIFIFLPGFCWQGKKKGNSSHLVTFVDVNIECLC